MLAGLAQESSAALARRLRRYTVPALLCIDEAGYLSYDGRYADLLFEAVTRRYDAQKPILLSTNKAFSDRGQVFPHAACVVTLADRLVHRAEEIEIEAADDVTGSTANTLLTLPGARGSPRARSGTATGGTASVVPASPLRE